jgi:glycosyltransferase involved in cell wall biosynthesis
MRKLWEGHKMDKTRKMLFVTEVLSMPFDEGMRNVAYSLHKNLAKKVDLVTVTHSDNKVDNLDIKRVDMNRLFLVAELKRLIKEHSPDVILYLPETSITFNSFLRGRILKLFGRGARVAIFATIRRDYTPLQRLIIKRFLMPDIVLLFGGFRDWSLRGINSRELPPAIDADRFSTATRDEKALLRKRYGVSLDKKVVLHVGHVRPTRNVSALIGIQRLRGIQVLIVDSTSTPKYEALNKNLREEGIIIFNRYIPDISEIYRLSDIYVFPVKEEIASINLPLSILEAMACGLPIVTTRFGGIEEYFKEDEGFRYFDTDDELLRIVAHDNLNGGINRQKVAGFTWGRLIEELIDTVFEK